MTVTMVMIVSITVVLTVQITLRVTNRLVTVTRDVIWVTTAAKEHVNKTRRVYKHF